jgi:hypothetical protein
MSQEDLKYTVVETGDSWRLCLTNTNTNMIQEEDLLVLKKCDEITLIRYGGLQRNGHISKI